MQADRCGEGGDRWGWQSLLPVDPVSQRTAQIRYIVVDVVDFSLNRSIEAQTAIMHRLSRVVLACLQCCVKDREQLHLLNLAEPDSECRFGVRVGLNENQDDVVLDVAGRRNVVGLGINMAQRVMSLAGPFQLFLGASVHARLWQCRQYRSHLKQVQAIVKHGQQLLCYAYHDAAMACFAGAATVMRPTQGPAAPVAPVLDLPLQRRATKRWPGTAEPSFRLQVR